MDRNTIAGLLLIGAILIGFQFFNKPSPEEVQRIKRQQDSTLAAQAHKQQVAVTQLPAQTGTSGSSTQAPDSVAQANLKQSLGVFADASGGEEKFYFIENELLKIKLSNKGGRIYSVELKKYKTFDGKPVILFDGDSTQFALNFFASNRSISTNDLYFTPTSGSFAVTGKETKTFGMRLPGGDGKYIEFSYTLPGNSYLLGFSVNSVGMENVVAANTRSYDLTWKVNVPKQEHDIQAERAATTIYYRYTDDEVDYLSETKDEQQSIKTRLKWIAFKQKFFSSALVADKSFDNPISLATATNPESNHVKDLTASVSIPFEHRPSEGFPMKFYFGPNHYKTLKQYDLGLEKLIPLGWGIFGWVNKFIVIPIFNFLSQFNMNYGIIILVLTLIIKLLLLPLTYKAYMSQAKMKVIKPEIDELQKNKGNDPMKLQRDMMGLYQKAGVNPLGGCLPLLLQMPILIALFHFFPSSIELRQQHFLWAHDLSTYDSIFDFGFKIPFYGDHVSLFTLLMTVSTIIYTRMNNQFTGANAQMKWMSYLMPLIFLGVFNNYSAGLSYYYFLANITSFGQQYLFKSFVDEEALHRKIQENKKKPASAKKSGFQQRLEEMAKQRGLKPKK